MWNLNKTNFKITDLNRNSQSDQQGQDCWRIIILWNAVKWIVNKCRPTDISNNKIKNHHYDMFYKYSTACVIIEIENMFFFLYLFILKNKFWLHLMFTYSLIKIINCPKVFHGLMFTYSLIKIINWPKVFHGLMFTYSLI